KKANFEIDNLTASSLLFSTSHWCVRKFHTPNPNCDVSEPRASTNNFPSDNVAASRLPEIRSVSPNLTTDLEFKSQNIVDITDGLTGSRREIFTSRSGPSDSSASTDSMSLSYISPRRPVASAPLPTSCPASYSVET